MTVAELITELQRMPQDARVQMGYDGNFVSVEPSGVVSVVTADDHVLYAEVGDVFIDGKN